MNQLDKLDTGMDGAPRFVTSDERVDQCRLGPLGLALYNAIYWPYLLASCALLFFPALFLWLITFWDPKRRWLAKYTSYWGAHYLAWAPFASVRVEGHSQRFRVSITPREAVAGVGAGDAFLAGYVAARYAGRPPAACLAHGVACGAESTQHLGAGIVDPQAVERLSAEVEVRALSSAEVS